MTDPILSAKNNAESNLFAGITAASMSFLVTAGEGLKFATGYNGTTTSAGTASTLNATGIQAALLAVGITSVDNLWIRNITDGSQTNVIAINTDSLTTMDLKSGSDNTWDNGDEFAIGTDVITLNSRDAEGNITAFENVRIKYADNATDTFYVEARGHAGTTPVAWGSGTYVSAFMNQSHLRGLQEQIALLNKDKAEDSKVLHTTGAETKNGVLSFVDFPQLSVYSAPTLDEQFVPKKWVEDNFQQAGFQGLITYPSGETRAGSPKGWYMCEPPTYDEVAIGTNNSRFGYDSSREKISFKIIGNGVSDNKINLALAKTGSPTDSAVIRVETDSAGEPSGTLADSNATGSVTGASLTTDKADTTVTMGGAFILTDNTIYHVVAERSGTLSTSNYFRLGISEDDPGYWKMSRLNAGVWDPQGDRNVYWSNFDGAHRKMFQATDGVNAFEREGRLVGFSDEAATEGLDLQTDCRDIPNVQFSNLDESKEVFLDNAGNLTQDETDFLIGIAITDEYIKRQPYYNLARELLTTQEGEITGTNNNEQVTTSPAGTKYVQYDTEILRTMPGLGIFDLSQTSDQITIPRSGVYSLYLDSDLSSGSSSFTAAMDMRRNGASIGSAGTTTQYPSFSSVSVENLEYSLNAGDVIDSSFRSGQGGVGAFMKNGRLKAELVRLTR